MALTQKGKLIIEEHYELGEVAGDLEFGEKIEFTSLVIYEPGEESKKVRGLKITFIFSKPREISYYAFLDLDEIEGISKAIEYIVNLSNKWKNTEKEYTEISFSTKDDFQICFFQNKTEQEAMSFIDRHGIVFSSPQDLNSVKALLTKGLNLLSEK